MKKKLKLFNRKHKKTQKAEEDFIDLDEEFDEEAYSDEDYSDEDYEGYDEDDYPDDEFEEEYGESYEDYREDDDFADAELPGKAVEETDSSESREYTEEYDRYDDVEAAEEYDNLEEAEVVEKYGRNEEAETTEEQDNYEEAEAAEEYDKYEEAEVAKEYDRNEEAEVAKEYDKYEETDVAEEHDKYEEAEVAKEYDKYEEAEAAEEYDKYEEAEVAKEYDKYEEAEAAEEYDNYTEAEAAEEYDRYDDAESEEEFDDYEDSDEDPDYYEDEEFEEDYGDYEDEESYDYDEKAAAAGYRWERTGQYKSDAGRRAGKGYQKRHSARKGRNSENPLAVVGAKILDFVRESSVAERAAAIVAVLLVAGAITTMVLYSKARDYSAEIGSFAEVGSNLQVSDAVGAYGLLAIADAEKARAYAAEIVEEEEEEEEISDVAEGVTVQMTLTTIKSDMKIKFINSESSKLVSNVHFEVEVVTPDGSKVTYDDHDKDGIIYKNNLTAGTYKVTPKALSSEYSEYKLETETKSLKIKDTVEMKAVDVSNEIKKESQVNAAVEDTAVGAVIESQLQDTVEYVESSKTPVDGEGGDGEYSYESIDKSEIADPSSSSKLTTGSVKRMAATRARASEDTSDLTSEDESETENEEDSDESSSEDSEEAEIKSIRLSPSDMSLKVGESQSFIVSGPEDYEISLSGSCVELDDQTVKAVSAGSATVTVTADGYESASISISVEGAEEEKEEETKGDIFLSVDSLTLEVGETGKLSAEGAKEVKYKSNDESVAKVSDGGVVTAVAAGSCTITAYADGYNDAKCEITVKAKGEDAELSMNVSKVTLVQGQTFKLSPKDKSLSVSYSSDDSDIATVSDGTITGVKAGETVVRASCSGFKDAKITVKVVKGSGTLKDKDGRIVYVKNSDGEYVEATYDDYYKGSKFYIRKAATSYKYTGWQNIDGKTYYYDKNGNYVTGEQVIQGAKYTFGSDGALSSSSGMLGIDVSKWNGNINWGQVKNSGVNFVIIRCGYRGSSAGALIEDPKFRANIQGASAAGLRVGVYFFSQAVNEVEAVEEASMCINLCRGYNLSFPIYIDVEGSNGRGDAVSVSQRTANIKAFCGTIQGAGYRAGVYANKTWFTEKINTAQLTGYKIWLAQYAASVSYTATRYDMWQYTSKGSVSGISGNVDMNILYN